jgi:hypothetical protein
MSLGNNKPQELQEAERATWLFTFNLAAGLDKSQELETLFQRLGVLRECTPLGHDWFVQSTFIAVALGNISQSPRAGSCDRCPTLCSQSPCAQLFDDICDRCPSLCSPSPCTRLIDDLIDANSQYPRAGSCNRCPTLYSHSPHTRLIHNLINTSRSPGPSPKIPDHNGLRMCLECHRC